MTSRAEVEESQQIVHAAGIVERLRADDLTPGDLMVCETIGEGRDRFAVIDDVLREENLVPPRVHLGVREKHCVVEGAADRPRIALGAFVDVHVNDGTVMQEIMEIDTIRPLNAADARNIIRSTQEIARLCRSESIEIEMEKF